MYLQAFLRMIKVNGRRKSHRKACLSVAWLLAVLIGSALNTNAVRAFEGVPHLYSDVPSLTVRVGVRDKAQPFSYESATKRNRRVLGGHGGYIVEVCRAVLNQMIGTGYFERYRIVAVPVSAANRFEKLEAREVDLLCGPDSITVDRLQRYNVSHPIFLSGIALAKRPSDQMPGGKYCGPIAGVVAGTTSQIAGLKAVLDAGLFRRFSPPIAEYLVRKAEKSLAIEQDTLEERWKRFNLRLFGASKASRFEHAGRNGIRPKAIRTEECPNGFDSGPIVEYNDHDRGLADLCKENILYYLGDVDIIKRKISENCNIEISQQTFTKEAYGIYFRKVPRLRENLQDWQSFKDAILYSEFNNVLLSQMQSAERLLENQYREEFGDAEMASDLSNFFSSFQYVTNY